MFTGLVLINMFCTHLYQAKRTTKPQPKNKTTKNFNNENIFKIMNTLRCSLHLSNTKRTIQTEDTMPFETTIITKLRTSVVSFCSIENKSVLSKTRVFRSMINYIKSKFSTDTYSLIDSIRFSFSLLTEGGRRPMFIKISLSLSLSLSVSLSLFLSVCWFDVK